jgi:hypothetical protein
MKILCCGDLHITNKTPRSRKDNYSLTQLGKVGQLIKVANDECDAMVMSGDVFDSPSISFSLLLSYFKLFGYCKVPVFSIFGQHDEKYRLREDTPLDFLDQCKMIKILGTGANHSVAQGHFHIFGCSYGEEIPKPIENAPNMLVIHRMVIDQKLWVGQKDYLVARDFDKWASGFDFVLSGDNHQSIYIKSFDGRVLFNSGSLMRSRSDQKNHRPVCGIYDTEKRDIAIREIEVQPIENVMNISESGEIDPEIRFKEFFDNMSPDKEKSRIDFIEILKDTISGEIDKGIKKFIMEVLSNVQRR